MSMANLASEQLAALSRLFSSGLIREMARKGRSSIFARLVTQAGIRQSLSASDRVRDVFDTAFALLKRQGYRHEYIYKAALTHNILLGIHGLKNASMLTEFRVRECKADVAILNGTSTVYEIKSERDSLSRLERQVAAYAKVFAKVYVVAAEEHVSSVLGSVPSYVGVMRLSKRYQISRLREALDQPERTRPDVIFNSIRTQEARLILLALGVQIPLIPNTELNGALRELFVRLKPREAHDGMVRVLRTTRNLLPLSDLIAQLPYSLKTAALSVPLRKLDHARLVSAVNTRFKDTLVWA